MAKKRIREREVKRQKTFQEYYLSRVYCKEALGQRIGLQESVRIHTKLQRFPRNSSPTRLRNRCKLSGRSRSYYRDFGLSRHFFREIVHQGVLPGVGKSSW